MDRQIMKMLASQAAAQVELEFNCGRMNYDDSTKKVTADPRRGTLKVKKQPHQGTIKIEWCERNKNATDFSREFFATSGKWIECTDTEARVFILMIDGRENFFWIQETNEEKDKEISDKFAELFGSNDNNSNNNNNDLLDSFRNAILGQGTQQPAQANLANLMGNMQQLQEEMRNDADLEDLFPPGEQLDTILELLSCEEDVMNDLIQHLPEGLNNPEDLASHLNSPQFRAACARLNQVFRTGEANILYNEMNLQFERVGVQPFLNAIEERYGPEEEDDEEEEAMED